MTIYLSIFAVQDKLGQVKDVMISEVAKFLPFPYVFNADHEAEKNILLQFLWDNTPPLMRELLLSFWDPTGREGGLSELYQHSGMCHCSLQTMNN